MVSLDMVEGVGSVTTLLCTLRKSDVPPRVFCHTGGSRLRMPCCNIYIYIFKLMRIITTVANRLLRALLEASYLELPLNEEVVFTTFNGKKMRGPLLEPFTTEVTVLVVLDKNDDMSHVWDAALEDTFLNWKCGSILLNEQHEVCVKSSNVSDIPEDGFILLLVGEVATPESVLTAAGYLLQKKNASEEKIIVLSPCTSRSAIEIISLSLPKARIIVGAIDPESYKQNVIPGVGSFGSRYGAEDQRRFGPNAHHKKWWLVWRFW